MILLMAEILHHLGCIKLGKKREIYHITTGVGFQPSTVPIGSGISPMTPQ